MQPAIEPREAGARSASDRGRVFGGRIFTPRDLAEMWQLSEQSIRRIFQDERGVFSLGGANPRGRRGYTTLRIPESVALEVWRRRGGAAFLPGGAG